MNGPTARLTLINYEAIKSITADEGSWATACVERMARDEGDRTLLLGMLFGGARYNPPRGFKGPATRDESKLKPHGTEAAHQRHKARGEDACEPCLAAANEARAASGRAVRARKRAAKQAANAAEQAA